MRNNIKHIQSIQRSNKCFKHFCMSWQFMPEGKGYVLDIPKLCT